MKNPENERANQETFWTNTPKSDNDPILILAQTLARRGFGILISEQAISPKGKKVSGYVAIHFTDPEARSVAEKLIKTPEIDILYVAYRGSLATLVFPPDINWDEETKVRVELYYLKQQEKSSKELGVRSAVRITQFRVRELLERHNPSPLNVDDIRSLLEEVVDGELARSSQTS